MKKFALWLIGFLLIGWAVVKMLPPRPTPGFDIDRFARLAVLVGGRVMPMDTLGRLSLLAMNHFGTYTGGDGKVSQPTALLARRSGADSGYFRQSNRDIRRGNSQVSAGMRRE